MSINDVIAMGEGVEDIVTRLICLITKNRDSRERMGPKLSKMARRPIWKTTKIFVNSVLPCVVVCGLEVAVHGYDLDVAEGVEVVVVT